MNIIPEPRFLEEKENTVAWATDYAVTAPAGYGCVLRYLADFVSVKEKAKGQILFETDGQMQEEEYRLCVGTDIRIVSKGACGAFRALSTLKQMMREESVRETEIHDYPMIKRRGFMLDVSRGRIPRYETLCMYADFLCDLKYNHLELYMDAPVFAYAHYEKYCRHAITVEELVRFKAYCAERFIELVPNQNSFGHMSTWMKNADFHPIGISRDGGKRPDALNPLHPGAREFIENLWSDLLPQFDSPYFNVGTDEVHSLGQGQTREACEVYGKSKVYTDHLNYLIRTARDTYGKTAMFWDDYVMDHPESLDLVDEDSVVLVWGYEAEWPYMPRCQFLQQKGRRFMVCPSTATFRSVTGRFDNVIFNVEAAVKACITCGGEGMLMTEWGDLGHAQSAPMSFLPTVFAAACAWNYDPKKELHPLIHCAYDKGRFIVRKCEEYLDNAVFGGKRMAEYLRIMSNYYLLEHHSVWSGPSTLTNAIAVAKGGESEMSLLRASMVENYLLSIEEPLAAFSEDTPFIGDIRCGYNTVLLFARYLRVRLEGSERENGRALREALAAQKQTFIDLWCKSDRPIGYDEFAENYDTLIASLA